MKSPDKAIAVNKLEKYSLQEASHLSLSFNLGCDTLGMRKQPLNLGQKNKRK